MLSMDIHCLQFLFSHFLLHTLQWHCVHLATKTSIDQVATEADPATQFTESLRAPLAPSVDSICPEWNMLPTTHSSWASMNSHSPGSPPSPGSCCLRHCFLLLSALEHLVRLPLPPLWVPSSFLALSTTHASCWLPVFELTRIDPAPTSWQEML